MNDADRSSRIQKNGFTLVEMMVVISIISILASILIPTLIGYTERAKEEVCKDNCLQLERMYETYLMVESIEDSEKVFEQYMHDLGRDICPGNGEISYVEGEVKCSLHSGEEDEGDVPYL